MSYILTFDVGTTSVKTCIFDQNFELLGLSIDEYKLSTSANDIVELDPEIYWDSLKKGIRNIINQDGIDANEVKVISITTQGETLIPVDTNGKALRNAIVWLDARASEEAKYISNLFTEDQIYKTTGLLELGSACPISKILWIKNNEPEIYNKTYKFMLLEDYLILKLTGKYVTDKSIMSSTGYFDINHRVLWNEILGKLNIESNKFPQILECGQVVGGILLDVADEIGINPAVVISTCGMDQVASAIGAGNITSGIITETTGTALAIAATTDKHDYASSTRVPIYTHAVKNKYIILPYCPTAGIIMKWFKDEFLRYEIEMSKSLGKSVYAIMDEIAEEIPPLSTGLILLPYFAGIITPESIPNAKGVFFGVSLDTKKAHFIRAILESVAYMLKENIELLEEMGVEVEKVCSLGGGSKSKLWCEIKANVIDREILTMQQGETTSLGAAILGAVSVGMYRNIKEACNVIEVKTSYKPDPETVRVYNRGYENYKKLYQTVKQCF